MSGNLFDLLAPPPSRQAMASATAPLSHGGVPQTQERQKRGRIRKTFRITDGDQTRNVTLIGRTAWALGALVHAGQAGCTPITTPGPRWSDYVFKLRKLGINVETIDEQHGGPYPGVHARYILRQRVEFVDESEGS